MRVSQFHKKIQPQVIVMALNIIILMTNLEIRILQMMALMNYVMTLVLVNHYKAQIGGDLHGTGAFYLRFCFIW